MSVFDTEYETDIRAVDTEYSTLLSREAGVVVDQEHTVKLNTVSVTVALSWKRNGQRFTESFDLTYNVDHDDESISLRELDNGDNDVGAAKLATANAAADRAVTALKDDVGLEHYSMTGLEAMVGVALTSHPEVDVRTETEVKDAE